MNNHHGLILINDEKYILTGNEIRRTETNYKYIPEHERYSRRQGYWDVSGTNARYFCIQKGQQKGLLLSYKDDWLICDKVTYVGHGIFALERQRSFLLYDFVTSETYCFNKNANMTVSHFTHDYVVIQTEEDTNSLCFDIVTKQLHTLNSGVGIVPFNGDDQVKRDRTVISSSLSFSVCLALVSEIVDYL